MDISKIKQIVGDNLKITPPGTYLSFYSQEEMDMVLIPIETINDIEKINGIWYVESDTHANDISLTKELNLIQIP